MNKFHRIQGITLVELMVAMAILSFLVVMLAQVLNNTGSAWTAGQAQTERRSAVRALSDTIARDLQTALMPIDPADPTTLQFVLNPSAVPATYQNPDALFWEAPIASDRTRGDVAEIGYFLKWDTSNASQPKPLFCRFFANPTDQNYLIYKQPSSWLSSSLLDALAPANNTGGNAYRGLFAENVIGFWIRCYDVNGNVISPATSYDSRVQKALPRSVKVSMVVTDSRGLAKLRQLPNYAAAGGANEPDLQQFINVLPDGVRQTCQSYTTEVYLQNAQ